MVTARAQKSRVEDLSARTPTSLTYANPDGTWTTETFAGMVRSKADADTWVPVDPAVQRRAGGFEPAAAPFDVKFSDGGDKKVGSVTTPGQGRIEVGWPTKLPTPQVDGETLTYPGVAAGADLVVNSHRDGFNFSVVLDGAPAAEATQVEYRVPFKFEGLTPTVKADGSVVFRDGNRRVAAMTAPVMWDSAPTTEDSEPTERRPVAVVVEGTGNARTLVLKPDMDYLRDPARAYPVVVDPTVVLDVAGDTWIANGLLSTSQHTSPELRVGSNNIGITKNRSFLDFDYTALESIPASAEVTSAELELSNFQTGNCNGTAIRMSRISESWSLTGLTWGNQPTVDSTGSSTTTDSHGATGCTEEATVSFDATTIVEDWLGGADQLGVRISADSEGANTGFRKYRSLENGDTAKAPKLTITYGSRPNTPTGLSISPGYNGYITTLTPTLSAVVTDPDAGQVRGYFEVKSGSTVVWSGYSPMATSGAQVSATVPTGILNEGGTYTVKAYGNDGELQSTAGTAATTFKVDTIAPTVTISSTVYTNGNWRSGAPVSDTMTFDGSTDTGGFYIRLNGVEYASGPNGPAGSGDWSKAWTPLHGWTTIEVDPVDKAGNRGPTATFAFGAGNPEFNVPNYWAESPSSFPIEASAPPGASGATLSWLVHGQTTWNPATQVTANGATWNGSVTTSGGRSATPSLIWAATAETVGSLALTGPALVWIKTCFSYPSAADKCTANRPVILTANARGGNYPEAQVGPASVALVTGEAQISDVDAADTKAGLGRTFSSLGDATLTAGVFGPGWSDPAVLAPAADSAANVVDNRAKDGSFVVINSDSGSQTFVLKQGTTTDYEPLQPTGDATALTLTAGTNGDPDKLELSRPLGTGSVTTTWMLKASDTGGDPSWALKDVDAPGTAADVTVANTAQRPIWIRESDPSVAATCTEITQTVGCRGLKINYTGSGAATRVASVDRVIGAATQGAVATKTLATYTYDGTGKLTSVCSAVPAAGKPALCVGYAYTTVSGRTLLSQMTPPGLKPWRFSYDSVGRLTTVNREKPGGGDATWSVDYSLTPSSSGLPDLSATTAAQWGQQTIPTKVFAVYEPFAGSASVTKAQLFYATSNGTTTNTAAYGPDGWLVDTVWLNAKGNEVQHLDGAGWRRVQDAPAAQRPQLAADASAYTLYNTWGDADTVGTRVVDEYGPAHTATLQDGTTTGLFRTHTKTMYDDDPNVDPALVQSRPQTDDPLGLVVRETTSVADAERTVDHDPVVTEYGYAPVVTADGSGWTLGMPTKIRTQIDANSWSESITRFDAQGREIESRQPGGAADGSGAGADAHATVTSYYTATGSGDCGGKPAWDGLVCKVGPAAQPTGPSMPITFHADFNEDLQPTLVREISGGVLARTTSTARDALGRPTTLTNATHGPNVANETIVTAYVYDDASGLPTATVSGGETITTAYDSWGRPTSYVDALGTSSTTTYDVAGQIASFDDGTATYTYGYDDYGLLTSVDAGGGVGTFAYAYSPYGDLETVTYPNGVVSRRTFSETGTQIGLSYEQGSTPILDFSAATMANGHTIAQSSVASTQAFGFDRLGRLLTVRDRQADGCTTRIYGYDASSNRASSASYGPGVDLECQSSTPVVSKTNSYDTAGRLRNSGYTYDTLGRTLNAPQLDAGPHAAGDLVASYQADDMVASLSQDVSTVSGPEATVMTYSSDPSGRVDAITTTTDGVEGRRSRYRFADSTDRPATVESSEDGGDTWTSIRYVSVLGLGMVASYANGPGELHLRNPHGDLVATIANVNGTATVSSYSEADEFGNRSAEDPPSSYGWLGAYQRSSDALGGLYLMGHRLYNPTTATFGTPDPIRGGNSTQYGYPEDPVSWVDLDGLSKLPPEGAPARPGCRTYRTKQKYGLGYTYYGVEISFRFCWRNGRIRGVTGSASAWANFNNQVQNAMGPTNIDRIAITSSYVSKGGRSTLYFWFQSRSCADGPIHVLCSGWKWHRLAFRVYSGGTVVVSSRS